MDAQLQLNEDGDFVAMSVYELPGGILPLSFAVEGETSPSCSASQHASARL